MKSKSLQRKSQFKILEDELISIRSSFLKDELHSLLLQMDLMLSEIDLVGDSEEFEYANPIEVLRGHLIGISDPGSLADWHAILSFYLFNRIQKSESENNSRLIELALQSLNISKAYSEEAKRQEKIEVRKRSAGGTRANAKKSEPLEKLEKAAYKRYERAIRLIQMRNRTAAAPTVITYLNIAKIVYPKIEHLKRNERGRQLIGQSTQNETKNKTTPIKALAALFERAVARGILKWTVEYRKSPTS